MESSTKPGKEYGEIQEDQLVSLGKRTRLDMKTLKYMKTTYEAVGGKLSQSDFINVYSRRQAASELKTAEFLSRVFRAYDTDNSGTMDFEEFVMMMASIVKGNLIQRLTLVFKLCDDDRSGTIEQNELVHTIKSLKFLISAEDFDDAVKLTHRVFATADADGDGQVTMTEFMEAFEDDPECKQLITVLYAGIVEVLCPSD